MSWRGLVAVVALLAAGIVGGFVTAEEVGSSPSTATVPEPVAASDPEFPIDPTASLKDDPPQPALDVRLPMRRVSVGSAPDRITFLAPRGWTRMRQLSNEVKYKPAGYPDNTYVLRVEQVTSDHQRTQEMVQSKLDDLNADETQVEETLRTTDQLEVSYVSEGYRRFALYTWIDKTRSGEAEIEVAVTGREKDFLGMRDLMVQVYRSLELA